MILSVRKLWIGFDKSVDGMVLMIANRDTLTQSSWAVGPWCSIEGGPALSRRGAVLLRKEIFGGAPTEVEEGAEYPLKEREVIEKIRGMN